MRVRFPRNAPQRNWREIAELRVEHGRTLDRWIPSFLLDSPVSLAGAALATVFGFAWGALWSTGRAQREDGLIIFRGMPRWTHARGGVCVGSCFLTHRATEPRAVRDHERVHVRQWRRYGLLMPVLYLLAGRDPLRNRFEIEAGLTDGGYARTEKG